MCPSFLHGCKMQIPDKYMISEKEDHLRMNVAPDLNNHLWSIDLFRSMIIKKNSTKVRDSHWIVIG